MGSRDLNSSTVVSALVGKDEAGRDEDRAAAEPPRCQLSFSVKGEGEYVPSTSELAGVTLNHAHEYQY